MAELYEYFQDPAYFDMWAVRPVGERRWGFCFHVPSQQEAHGLADLLNSNINLPKLDAIEMVCRMLCTFKGLNPDYPVPYEYLSDGVTRCRREQPKYGEFRFAECPTWDFEFKSWGQNIVEALVGKKIV